jgi:RHS repeat-associated protein
VVSSNGNSTAQRFKYNGKELTQALGLNLYEYGARMYDPAIGQFTTIDPRSETYYEWSPYNYTGNSPIQRIDVNGEFWGLVVKAAKAGYKGVKAYRKAKKAGKSFSVKKFLKKEGLDIIDNVKTLADGELGWDDAIAIVDLATGFGDEAKKGMKSLGINQKALSRGRKNEKKVLNSEDLNKNTKKYPATDPKTGKEVNTIPDSMDGAVTEIKDVKTLSDSKQLRAQRQVANSQGKKHVVITGTNTKVSKTVTKNSTVKRRDDIGPQN